MRACRLVKLAVMVRVPVYRACGLEVQEVLMLAQSEYVRKHGVNKLEYGLELLMRMVIQYIAMHGRRHFKVSFGISIWLLIFGMLLFPPYGLREGVMNFCR